MKTFEEWMIKEAMGSDEEERQRSTKALADFYLNDPSPAGWELRRSFGKKRREEEEKEEARLQLRRQLRKEKEQEELRLHKIKFPPPKSLRQKIEDHEKRLKRDREEYLKNKENEKHQD